jgi:hypothetical protein
MFKSYEDDKERKHKNILLNFSELRKKDIKRNSSFDSYFDNKIKSFQIMISTTESLNDSSLNLNEFYIPELFEVIASKLYILPLWSGLLINSRKDINLEKDHLVNNIVENHFNHLKNNTLGLSKKTKNEKNVDAKS